MTDNQQNSSIPDDFENLPPRRRRSWKKVAVVMLCVIAVATGTLIILLRSEPEVIKEQRQFIRQTSKTELQEIAQNVERKFFDAQFAAKYLSNADFNSSSIEQVLAAIPKNVDPVTKIHLTVNEVNAWMITGFVNWMAYRDFQLPDEISEPTFALDGDKMVLAFTVSTGGISQVFSAIFDVVIRDDGMAELTVNEFYAGLVPIPAGNIGQYLAEVMPENESISDAARWLDKLEFVEFKPAMKLESKRKAQILDYAITSKGIDLTIKLVNYARRPVAKPTLAAVGAH